MLIIIIKSLLENCAHHIPPSFTFLFSIFIVINIMYEILIIL